LESRRPSRPRRIWLVTCLTRTPEASGESALANYAFSGLIDWKIALLFIVGGIGGGILGICTAILLVTERHALSFVFAAVVFAVAIYMLARAGFLSWR